MEKEDAKKHEEDWDWGMTVPTSNFSDGSEIFCSQFSGLIRIQAVVFRAS